MAKRVTRTVDPAAVRDLLERPPRASLAFDHGRIVATPAAFRLDGEACLVGLSTGGPDPLPETHSVATLLIDDGCYFFELRAVKIRGRLVPAERPPADGSGLAWFELRREKLVAWDYATLHEEETDVPG